MSQPGSMFQFPEQQPAPRPPPKSITRFWWVLVVVGTLVVGSCATLVGATIYLGATSPETKVYASNEIPDDYSAVLTDLRLVDPGETVIWFYSDALGDVRDGFSFVSDRKVVVHDGSRASNPSTVVPFAEIVDVDLHRDTSWVMDSTITLLLRDGRSVAFFVSSELDRDQLVYETIAASMPKGAGAPPASDQLE